MQLLVGDMVPTPTLTMDLSVAEPAQVPCVQWFEIGDSPLGKGSQNYQTIKVHEFLTYV